MSNNQGQFSSNTKQWNFERVFFPENSILVAHKRENLKDLLLRIDSCNIKRVPNSTKYEYKSCKNSSWKSVNWI